ncbi:MAG: hypothetical protein K8R56_07375, partial [Candidatus Eisenbacteria bacterium]|nr:hypothetical protein [Candidatus Eisenbacteria bacterium]
PGFVPEYIRPLFCVGKGPFRWAALSGDPDDIRITDEAALAEFPDDARLKRWIPLAQKHVQFQGLPARICWLGYGERHRLGLRFNQLVREGKLKAPIVIGRDHLDTGSVASPYRETEAMKDGSDAVADWPLLNALLNTASGASWVSLHHGGGVGIGNSIHSGMVIVCDGSAEADARLARVLVNDSGTGVMRHADAGYEEAIAHARATGMKLPGITSVRQGCGRPHGVSDPAQHVGGGHTRCRGPRDPAVPEGRDRVPRWPRARGRARRRVVPASPRCAAAQCQRQVGHAGPGRLSHAHDLRRPSRGRVPDEAGGCDLRRDRGTGRRHPLHGACDRRGEGGSPREDARQPA